MCVMRVRSLGCLFSFWFQWLGGRWGHAKHEAYERGGRVLGVMKDSELSLRCWSFVDAPQMLVHSFLLFLFPVEYLQMPSRHQTYESGLEISLQLINIQMVVLAMEMDKIAQRHVCTAKKRGGKGLNAGANQYQKDRGLQNYLKMFSIVPFLTTYFRWIEDWMFRIWLEKPATSFVKTTVLFSAVQQ